MGRSDSQDEIYGKKRESSRLNREENDRWVWSPSFGHLFICRYYAKVQADRQARHERFKSERAKEDAARQTEEIARMREEANQPAYAAEVEDCTTLIGWFKGKYIGGEVPSTSTSKSPAPVEGVKVLEIRKVEDDFQGMTLKKKEDDLEGFFGGSGKKKGVKSKKQSTPANGTATPAEASGAINLPMSLLTALLGLGIPPPIGKEDVSRVVGDLETKKAWFEANSAAKTKVRGSPQKSRVALMSSLRWIA